MVVAAGHAASAPDTPPDSRLAADSREADAPSDSPETTALVESAFVRQVRDKASDMVLTAMDFLGVPYRRGGASEDKGFDCSGFTRYVFGKSLGLVLPHRADEQARAPGFVAIKRDELKPGDLVFFNTLRRTFSHVGIYVGDGKFIHAPRPGGEVRVEDMNFAYWQRRFTGARRAELPLAAVAAAPATPLPVPASAEAALPAPR